MAFEDSEKTYLFPRIPLRLNLPDGYPDVGAISNISVLPEIADYRITQDELELKGNYQINVSYFKKRPASEQAEEEVAELSYDQFFSALKVKDDGLFADDDEREAPAAGRGNRELYTVSFERPFHTYVDLEFINPPRSFKPVLMVDKISLEPGDDRILKGELLLELSGRTRGRNR